MDSPLGSVDKALRALTELSQVGPGGAGLADLARVLEIGRPTLHRTLAALRHRGFVEQTSDGRYRLGPAALALGATHTDAGHLPTLLHPALSQLCTEVSELVHLGVLVGRDVLYLDKVEPDRAVRVWSQIGRQRPAVTTAMGRAILSRLDLDPEQLAWYAGTDITGQRLAAELDAARTRGWAGEWEEGEPGIGCLAVPLARDRSVVAAVSVTAPLERLAPTDHARIADALLSDLPRWLPAPLALA